MPNAPYICAYAGEIQANRNLTRDQIVEKGKKYSAELCGLLSEKEDFLCEAQVERAYDFIERYYRDYQGKELSKLWEGLPDLAAQIACWQSVNDVHEFIACFISGKAYGEDLRRIKPALEESLMWGGLLDLWNDAVSGPVRGEPYPSLLLYCPRGRARFHALG